MITFTVMFFLYDNSYRSVPNLPGDLYQKCIQESAFAPLRICYIFYRDSVFHTKSFQKLLKRRRDGRKDGRRDRRTDAQICSMDRRTERRMDGRWGVGKVGEVQAAYQYIYIYTYIKNATYICLSTCIYIYIYVYIYMYIFLYKCNVYAAEVLALPLTLQM